MPKETNNLTTLLLGHTDGTAATTGRLGVLSADAEAPVVAETTVGTDLLQALKIITELGVDTVGEDLGVLAVDNVALTVEEPLYHCQTNPPGKLYGAATYAGDLVLGGVLDDGDDTLELFGRKLTGAVREKECQLFCLIVSKVPNPNSPRIRSHPRPFNGHLRNPGNR